MAGKLGLKTAIFSPIKAYNVRLIRETDIVSCNRPREPFGLFPYHGIRASHGTTWRSHINQRHPNLISVS
jgi:hypothetical protein